MAELSCVDECVSITSKSPAAVLLASLEVAKQSLPAYSHRYSRKTYTQHQLFACLVLKNFLKTDYRGVTAQLQDCSALQECTAASGYFVRRRARADGPWKTMVYHYYPKLGVICDVQSHFILAFDVRRGPKPDVAEFKPLLDDALTRVGLTTVVADAGYDSESNHCHARQKRQVRTVIPAKHGRPTNKPARGRHRRLMQVRFNADAYRQRAQVETVMSMIKRRQGSNVRGITYHSQCRDLRLMALTHNIMILLFY